MEAKYHNVLTGRMIKTDGVVFKNLTKNAVILQSRIRRLINKPPEKPLIVAKPKKEKKYAPGITNLVFTYDEFKSFAVNAYDWKHTKQRLPFNKILTDYEGEELIEGDIVETTASERKRMMGGTRYDYSFRLRFKTQKFDYVEFIVNCDEDDKVLYQLIRASGIDAYGEGFKITDEGRITAYYDE